MRNSKSQTNEILKRLKIKQKKRRNIVTILSSVTFCAVFVSVYMMSGMFENNVFIKDEEQSQSESSAVVGNSPNDNATSDNQSKDDNSKQENDGIYIPAQKVDPVADGIMSDMLGFVVYDTKVYTQFFNYNYSSYTLEEKNEIIGEYLGKATGSIDEFSLMHEYDENLASSVHGDVYTLKDYDENFRICIVNENEGKYSIQYYQTLNEATMTTGKDLYGSERLNLKENYVSVKIQDYHDWYNETGVYNNVELNKDEIDEFIDVLCGLKFEKIDRDLFSTKSKLIHFEVENEADVILRCFENGYIMYEMYGEGRMIAVKLDNDSMEYFSDLTK